MAEQIRAKRKLDGAIIYATPEQIEMFPTLLERAPSERATAPVKKEGK